MSKIYYTYEELENDLREFAKKIKENDFKMIIPVTRGGLVPACYLAYLLGIKNIKTLCLNSYDDDEEQHKMNVISVPDIEDIPKDKVLVVDGIVDSGITLEKTKNLLVQDVKFFSIHYKPHSICIPDYYIHETDDWIVYPWECKE